jgi:hypothetical protein
VGVALHTYTKTDLAARLQAVALLEQSCNANSAATGA